MDVNKIFTFMYYDNHSFIFGPLSGCQKHIKPLLISTWLAISSLCRYSLICNLQLPHFTISKANLRLFCTFKLCQAKLEHYMPGLTRLFPDSLQKIATTFKLKSAQATTFFTDKRWAHLMIVKVFLFLRDQRANTRATMIIPF